jgi:hypothetical protein
MWVGGICIKGVESMRYTVVQKYLSMQEFPIQKYRRLVRVKALRTHNLEAIAIYCKERKMILRREHYNSFKSFTIGSITSVGKGPIPIQVRVFGSICVFPASCMNAK